MRLYYTRQEATESGAEAKGNAAAVPNQLYTVVGANHGGFSADENQKAWAAIRRFLQENVKGLGASAASK